ncbi:hypothetical protein MMC25_005055 [Agyrium rufum]|nr:hypothetical protein [Agyrium rufum]
MPSPTDIQSNGLRLMDRINVQYLLVSICLVIVVSYYVSAWYRLRQFNGPWLASFSEAWLFWKSTSGNLHLILYDVYRKHGDLARIGPNWLVTSDPDIIRYMSSARHKHKKSGWYASLKADPHVHSVFTETNLEEHDKLRAKMQPGYSIKENRDLEDKINDQVDSLVKLIETKYISTSSATSPLDFATAAQYFALDVITGVAFGKPFGYLRQDRDVLNFVKTVTQELPIATVCSSTPTLGRLVFESPLMSWIGPSSKDKDGRGRLMGMAQEVVAARFDASEKGKQSEDMLGSFIRNGLSRRQAESETIAVIVAGSDTTATAIRATILHLMTSPSVYSTLVAEIQEGIRNGSVSSPIKSTEASEMPYLQAVIKEGLRIHPPITGLLAKVVNPGGEVIKGRFVPGGTWIGHCPWGIERNAVFGDDVDVFRPERWLEAPEEQRRLMERTMELVFGAGRWGCLGKSIVIVELNKIFVELLRRFDFSLIYPDKPWNSRNFTLFLQKDMWVRATKRNEDILSNHRSAPKAVVEETGTQGSVAPNSA